MAATPTTQPNAEPSVRAWLQPGVLATGLALVPGALLHGAGSWLDRWLDQARDGTHAVFMHIPPLDPVGLRGGGFRSRKEAAKLMQMLADGRVDALFLGHIHSYYAFSAAGVPSYISGGGGAVPERFDGIGRHYLRVRASAAGIEDVAVVRID